MPSSHGTMSCLPAGSGSESSPSNPVDSTATQPGFPAVQAKLSGCCCEACMQAPRLLRPHKPQGYYGTYDQYLGFDSSQVIKLAQ